MGVCGLWARGLCARMSKVFQYRYVMAILTLVFVFNMGKLLSPCPIITPIEDDGFAIDNGHAISGEGWGGRDENGKGSDGVIKSIDDWIRGSRHEENLQKMQAPLLRNVRSRSSSSKVWGDRNKNIINSEKVDKNIIIDSYRSNNEASDSKKINTISGQPGQNKNVTRHKRVHFRNDTQVYYAKDLYGTDSVVHHGELKRMGLESTTRHNFKSPFIHDPHIYDPDTVRLAPGKRDLKVISCFNCPERFYQHNKDNNDFQHCPYPECELTTSSGYNPDAHVMIFWQDPGISKPPPKARGQAWAYMSWETPPHRGHPNPDEAWLDLFNWTFTYRLDSDFSLPYDTMAWRDRQLLHSDDFYLKMAKKKTKTAVWWVSHCETRSHREEYVREMKKHIDVDIFGACTNNSCEGSRGRGYRDDCFGKVNDTYKFYLSFENSLCEDYATEKFFKMFRRRYNIIPVVLSSLNYNKYLPKNILVNTANFKSAKELALHLKDLGNDHLKYARMLKEKDRLVSRNRKMDWCDFCEKLHTGQFKSRIIHNVREFSDDRDGKCWDRVIRNSDVFQDLK